jgi:hypothetical protein
MSVFAFECQFADFPPSVRNALSAGKARYDYLLGVREAYPDATFADIRVRKIGPAVTSEAFLRNAAYRGMPNIRCGDKVTVNGRRGFIVGHNGSANFDVVFDEGSEWAGCVHNVHPSEIRAGRETSGTEGAA